MALSAPEEKMLEAILTASSLPNLHPALVHFPLALLPVALGFDLATLALGRPWLDRAAALLYALGALGAWAALEAGERAVDSLVAVPPLLQPAIARHSDWAHYTLWLFGALAALRLVIRWRDRGRDRLSAVPARGLVAVAALVGVGMLGKTADLGGALVYRHGLAISGRPQVTAAETAAPQPAGSGPASSRLVKREGSSLVWRPLAEDGAALEEILSPAPGFSGGVVSSIEPEEPAPAPTGLALMVSGRTVLVLPGSFADVHVEAEIELLDFRGKVGVAHHVRDETGFGLFTVAHDGWAELVQVGDGGRRVLDEGAVEAASGVMRLGVSAAGRHLKGLVDGRTVTHGHRSPGPEGYCGLFVDGEGVLRLLSLAVTSS